MRAVYTAGSLVDLGLLVLAGVTIPAGQMAATLDAMSFSREQEEEADLLGAQFMASSGYDPRAAAQVWEQIIDEEKKASGQWENNLFEEYNPTRMLDEWSKNALYHLFS